jgi:type 1 glutamine amidotransferase
MINLEGMMTSRIIYAMLVTLPFLCFCLNDAESLNLRDNSVHSISFSAHRYSECKLIPESGRMDRTGSNADHDLTASDHDGKESVQIEDNSSVTCESESNGLCTPSQQQSKFKALVLAENGGQHKPFVDAGRVWLEKLARDSIFQIDSIENTDLFTVAFLAQYRVIIQLDYAPYPWGATARDAFIKYIEKGTGGWVGFHHAALLGDFDGYTMWPWFSSFMGDIKFDNYIAGLVRGTVHVEDIKHPCMKNIPETFIIEKEEWYTFNVSPRAKVHVLASVDESSYSPASDIKMGDHPVVWTNENVAARNIYIFMGHAPELYSNPAFTQLFSNSIFWAARH